MDRDGFVKTAVLAFGLVGSSFFVRGFGQLFVGPEAADIVRTPLLVGGFCLVVYLFVRATLDWVGLWTIDESR